MTQDKEAERVEFFATVARVNTLADMGLRVTLDLPEDAVVEAAWLMEMRRREVVLRVRIEADEK